MQVSPAAPAAPPYARYWEDVTLDRDNREMIKVQLVQNPVPYTPEEDAMIANCLLVVDKLGGDVDTKHSSDIKFTKHETYTPLQQAYMCHDEKLGITYGKVMATVRGASVLDVVAYLTDYVSNFNAKHSLSPNQIEARILEHINNHHQVVYYKGRGTGPFRDRDFVWSGIVKRLADDVYICVFHPTQHKDAPITSSAVRAESTRV